MHSRVVCAEFVRKSAAAIDEGPTSISDESVEIAAMYLKDAMHGRGIGAYATVRMPLGMRCVV